MASRSRPRLEKGGPGLNLGPPRRDRSRSNRPARSRIAPWGGAFGHEAAEAPAMAGNQLVGGVEEPRCSKRSEQLSDRPGQPDLRQQRDRPAAVARNRCPISKEKPPALVARLLGD
jgi:hypothetical protein